MTAIRVDIAFSAVDGITLRGWFYRPGGSEKRPCIIMANGVRFSFL
jgi:hypothetical protein